MITMCPSTTAFCTPSGHHHSSPTASQHYNFMHCMHIFLFSRLDTKNVTKTPAFEALSTLNYTNKFLPYVQVHSVKPKLDCTDFHRNFPAGKVVNTNHESRGCKPSRHAKMLATKSVTSPRQTRLCRSNGI